MPSNCYVPGHGRSTKVARHSLLFIFMFISLGSYSQSFYHFENRLPSGTDSPTVYSVFLTLQLDGNASARILFKKKRNGNSTLVEQRYKDSVPPPADSTHIRWLVPVEADTLISGRPDPIFFIPRFVFTRQTQDGDEYYVPTNLEYQTKTGEWQPGTMLFTEEKTIKELIKRLPLVDSFYKPDETFSLYFKRFGPDQPPPPPPPPRYERIHFIAVGNTNSGDIGYSCTRDINQMIKTINKLATDIHVDITPYIFTGKAFSKEAVEKAIADLIVYTAGDIIIFYFSGHGFRLPNDVSRFPRMSFRTSNTAGGMPPNLAEQEVYEALYKKNAKLTIVISDCCNEYNGDVKPLPTGVGMLRTKPGQLEPSAGTQLNWFLSEKLLFPSRRLGLLISAADRNQYAGCSTAGGGYYTSAFNARFLQILYGLNNNATWENDILLPAGKETLYQMSLSKNARCIPPCIQQPIFFK